MKQLKREERKRKVCALLPKMKSLFIIVLVIGTLITSLVSVPSVFAGAPLIHDYIGDRTAEWSRRVHSSQVYPSDALFRLGTIEGDIDMVLGAWVPDIGYIMRSTSFEDKLFELAETREQQIFAAGIACHKKADEAWSWTNPTIPPYYGYIQEAGIGPGTWREDMFKWKNDVAVKKYNPPPFYYPVVPVPSLSYFIDLLSGEWETYGEWFIDAYKASGGQHADKLTPAKVATAGVVMWETTHIWYQAVDKIPHIHLYPPPSFATHPYAVLNAPCYCWWCPKDMCKPGVCHDWWYTREYWWDGYGLDSASRCFLKTNSLFNKYPTYTEADFTPVVWKVEAEESERPYPGLWPHVYAFTENIGNESWENVWSSYNFSGEAKYDRSSKCPGNGIFKGDVCWKQLLKKEMRSSREKLIKDPDNQYYCIGLLSQNWEPGNNEMVGVKCRALKKGDYWWGELEKDSNSGEAGPSQCTYLCFNKKTLRASECSGSFKGDICWKQKIRYKETGKKGESPIEVPLVKYDPENPYFCFGIVSQNWEKDNDDMVGIGCGDVKFKYPYLYGVLRKDWRRAESGPGQCTFLCINARNLGKPAKIEIPGIDIPGCQNGLFIYDKIRANYSYDECPKSASDEGYLPHEKTTTLINNDPSRQYECFGLVTHNWDNFPPTTECKKVKNDEFVGIKCTTEWKNGKWSGRLEADGKNSELELSECSFLCINRNWSKCYSDSVIEKGEKGETIRAFFPASQDTHVTFRMKSDSRLPEPGVIEPNENNNELEHSFYWNKTDFKTTNIEVIPSTPDYMNMTHAGDIVKINATFTSTKPNVNTHAKFFIDGAQIADVPLNFGSQTEIEKGIRWIARCPEEVHSPEYCVKHIEDPAHGPWLCYCGSSKIQVVINPYPEEGNFGNPKEYIETNTSNNWKEKTIDIRVGNFYVEEMNASDIIDKPEDKINLTDIEEKEKEIGGWLVASPFNKTLELNNSGVIEIGPEGVNIVDEEEYYKELQDYAINISNATMKMYVLEKKRWELENVVVNQTSPACAYGKAYFTSIQEAIDSDITKENNTIIICNGTYYENVKVHKPVKIVGLDPSNTIVEGIFKFPTKPVFEVNISNVEIKGLTIKGTTNSASPSVYLREVNNSEIRENIIKNNWIGVYLPGSSDNIITRNRIISNYYGVSYLSTGPNLVYDNYFNNTENFASLIAHNSWNVTKMEIGYGGRNIVGDYYLGGNYWAKPDGTGFSQTCYDLDGDGFCDEPYTLDHNNIDYLPLKDCSCESCEDCMDKLNDPTCKFVKLTWSINSTGTCIDNPPGFFNKTLDCKEHGIKGDGTGYGIYFSNNNNTIKNCLISNFSDAIRLENSNLNVLEENVFLNNTFGIHFYTSLNNSITKNIFRDNWHGIDVYSSSQNNNITFNILNSNEVGIIDVRSGKNRIIDNYVNNSSYDGIILYWNSDYSNVENNTVENSNHGITVRASRFDRIRGNVLNLNNISIALVPRTPAERTSDIIVEENLILDSSKYGLYLESTSSNNLIDNSILNYQSGIYLNLSSSNNIANNTVSCEEFTVPLIGASPRRGNAIELWKSSWNNITGNILSSNYDGIQLMDSSNHNAVLDNIVESSDHAGICLNKGWLDLNPVMYNNITNNIVHHNYEGISLYEYDHGLCRCDYNSIHGNEIFNNRYGIKISQSGGNEIKDNIVYTNEYGINIEGTYCEFNGGCYNSNTIYNNIFDNSINAYDSGCDIWNIQKTPRTNIIDGPFLGGNYWSDYTGTDNNYDGLGDTLLPYNCGGNIVSSGDWNPLVEIKIPPEFIVARINNSIYYFPYNENTNVFGSPVQIDTLGPCTGSPKIDGRVVDFDNDGDYDVLIDTATWYSAGPMFRVYENTGTDFVFRYGCSFGIPDFGDSWGDNSFVVAGDFDEDGDWEFIGSIIREFAPYTYEIKFKRWENLGDFSFNLLYDLPLDVSQIEHPHDIESADFNNDGHLDLLISDYPNGGIHNGKAYLYTGNGAWGFTPVTNNPVISIPNQPIPAIVAGDFVGGWSVDVIAGLDDDGDPGQAFLFKNDGTGVFTQTPVTGGCMPGVWNGHEPFDVNRQNEPDQYDKPGAGVMDAKDFDKNGRLDIVTSFTGPTDISSWPHPLCRINGCPPSSPKGTFYAATTVHPEAYLIAAPDVTVLCACEEALYGGNVSNPEEKINSIRKLRDGLLRDKYVNLYYEYDPEIRGILIKEPYLLIGAANLLVKYIPAVNYVTGRDGEDLKIEEEDVTEAISFIENLKKGIWERREEIGINRSSNIIEFLEKFEKQVNASKGKTFSQAFRDSIYARWPVTETEYLNSITQPIDVSKIRYKFTAVDEKWAAKWTTVLLYGQKETKYSIEIFLNKTGYVTRVDFERWGFPITEIPYDLAKQSLASLPPGFAIDP